MPCPKCGKDDCPNWILSKTLPVALMQALSVNDPEAENLSDEELVESQDIEDTLLQDQQVQPQNDPYMALPNEPSDAAKNEYASNGLNMLQMRKKMLGEPIHVQIDDRRTEECAHVGPHSISPVFQSYFGGVPKVEHLDDAEFYRLKRQVLYKKDPKKPPYASYNQQLAQPLGGQQEEEENGFNINYNASLEDLLARRNVLINIPSSSNGEVARQLREIEAIINNRGLGGNSEAAASNSVKFVDRRIPAQKRYQLVKLLNAGYGISRAAKTLNISRSGAIYVRDRAAELGLLRNRQARKRVFLQKEINDFILQTLRVNHSTTKKELRDMLRKQGHNLTLAQVRYRIGALGFTWRKMKKVQVISPQNRQKRLDTRAFWESENYDFRNYLFVDECTVVLGRQQQFCWVRKGEKVPCKGRVTHGSGYHVFAGISWRGATDILVWNSKHRMNSAFYCNHNIKEIVAKARHLFEAGQFQLVQDNHRAHVSNYTKNYLEQAGIDTFVWPPQSPDWNPPEFSWRDLKRYVEEKAPKTMAELLNVIQEFWATKVTPAYCRTIIRNSINNIKKSHDGLNHEKDAPRDTLYQK